MIYAQDVQQNLYLIDKNILQDWIIELNVKKSFDHFTKSHIINYYVFMSIVP